MEQHTRAWSGNFYYDTSTVLSTGSTSTWVTYNSITDAYQITDSTEVLPVKEEYSFLTAIKLKKSE